MQKEATRIGREPITAAAGRQIKAHDLLHFLEVANPAEAVL